MMIVGERIKQLRQERGLTQLDLAERLGVAQPVVCRFERGHDMRLSTLQRIAEALGVSMVDLLDERKSK